MGQDGWKCNACGKWMPTTFEGFHVCETCVTRPEPEPAATVYTAVVQRIIAVLERIADAMEARVPPRYQPGACEFCGSINEHRAGCPETSEVE